jgi:predicted O-methyltransferase YrrM
MFKSKLCLEIGIQTGMASAYMCAAGSQVIGIDILVPGMVMPDSFHFIHGDSTDMLTYAKVMELVSRYGKLGLVFQDSSHHYLPSKKEWELYSALLAPNAIWICDDITVAFYNTETDPLGKGMVQYFDELPGEKRLYQDVLHRGNCQGIVLT